MIATPPKPRPRPRCPQCHSAMRRLYARQGATGDLKPRHAYECAHCGRIAPYDLQELRTLIVAGHIDPGDGPLPSYLPSYLTMKTTPNIDKFPRAGKPIEPHQTDPRTIYSWDNTRILVHDSRDGGWYLMSRWT